MPQITNTLTPDQIFKQFKKTELYQQYLHCYDHNNQLIPIWSTIKLIVAQAKAWEQDPDYIVLVTASILFFSSYLQFYKSNDNNQQHSYQQVQIRLNNNLSSMRGFYPSIKVLKYLKLSDQVKTKILKLVIFYSNYKNIVKQLFNSKNTANQLFNSSDLELMQKFNSCLQQTTHSSNVSEQQMQLLNGIVLPFNQINKQILPTKEQILNQTSKQDFKTSKPQLVFMIGLPRSGKSTYIKQHLAHKFKNFTVISRDQILMTYAKPNQTYNQCFKGLTDQQQILIDQQFIDIYKQALLEHKNIIIDRTNLTKTSRQALLDLNLYPQISQYSTTAIVFCTDLTTIIKRNQRDYKLEKSLIYQMKLKLNVPILDEFNQINYVWE